MIALFLHDATMLPVEAPKSMIAMFSMAFRQNATVLWAN
jgi:hypothetical protein